MVRLQIVGDCEKDIWLYKGDPAFQVIDNEIKASCKWWSTTGLDDRLLDFCDEVFFVLIQEINFLSRLRMKSQNR